MHRPLGSIEQLRALWDHETSSSSARACWAIIAVGIVAAALVGRLGYDWSRAAALAIVIVAAVPKIVRGMLLRRRERDPQAVMDATIRRVDPEIAAAAARALKLSRDTEDDPRRGSLELARLHFARALGKATPAQLESAAGRSAWQATVIALFFGAAGLTTVALDPFRIIEGIDVLAARDGVAPIQVEWVELPRVTAEPPAYLSMSREPVRPYFPTALHVGTQVTISAIPIRDGRELVLSDGIDQVPFYDDGDGAIVARWTVTADVSLRVGARFGGVIIQEPVPLDIHAIADHAPVVTVDGAPATIRLLEQPTIQVHWKAHDDHGLREVVLVLKAGEQEERRPLSKQQGGSAIDRGGIELRSDDKFIKKSYLPIEVTVQALDNDPVTGPKWGISAPLVLIPPQIGEREAMRYQALKRGRDAVTDLLAARLVVDEPTLPERNDIVTRERRLHDEAIAKIAEALDGDYGGLRLGGRAAALVRGQVELMDKAVTALATGAIAQRYAALVERTEGSLLAIDSGLGFIGARDARRSAHKLADVATDAATAIKQSRDKSMVDRAVRRLLADLDVLRGSADHLILLGDLGRDLGEIVQNGVRRIERPWSVGDKHHAQLAAEDLAARLRDPDASFGSAGSGSGDGHGHGQQGGVEAGGQAGQGSDGEPSQAAEQAEGVDQALEQLRQEHAQQMAEVEKALQDAMTDEQREQMEQDLREMAKEVRKSVADLPQMASDPSSAGAAAAAGRSEAESSASSMERGDLGQAVEQAQRAIESLRNAERKGGQAGSDEQQVGEQAGRARQNLERLLDKAKRQLDEMKRQASDNASEQLKQSAEREKELADRARAIKRQSEESEAPLPGEMLDRLREAAEAMDDAAGRLNRGRGSEGLESQREAQRLLEMSQPESEQESERADSEGADGENFARDADVPPEKRDERADAFRKRVTEGLGRKAPPHLKEALRRYTESLLR